MPNHSVILICAEHCRRAAIAENELVPRLKAAMREALSFPEVLSPVTDDELMKGAFLAVWDISDEADRARLDIELQNLNALCALVSGIPVDVSQVPVNENPIGLLNIWRQINPIPHTSRPIPRGSLNANN